MKLYMKLIKSLQLTWDITDKHEIVTKITWSFW